MQIQQNISYQEQSAETEEQPKQHTLLQKILWFIVIAQALAGVVLTALLAAQYCGAILWVAFAGNIYTIAATCVLLFVQKLRSAKLIAITALLELLTAFTLIFSLAKARHLFFCGQLWCQNRVNAYNLFEFIRSNSTTSSLLNQCPSQKDQQRELLNGFINKFVEESKTLPNSSNSPLHSFNIYAVMICIALNATVLLVYAIYLLTLTYKIVNCGKDKQKRKDIIQKSFQLQSIDQLLSQDDETKQVFRESISGPL